MRKHTYYSIFSFLNLSQNFYNTFPSKWRGTPTNFCRALVTRLVCPLCMSKHINAIFILILVCQQDIYAQSLILYAMPMINNRRKRERW